LRYQVGKHQQVAVNQSLFPSGLPTIQVVHLLARIYSQQEIQKHDARLLKVCESIKWSGQPLVAGGADIVVVPGADLVIAGRTRNPSKTGCFFSFKGSVAKIAILNLCCQRLQFYCNPSFGNLHQSNLCIQHYDAQEGRNHCRMEGS
jgi:hypothetical protein